MFTIKDKIVGEIIESESLETITKELKERFYDYVNNWKIIPITKNESKKVVIIEKWEK